VDEREVLAQSRAAADSLMLRAGSARFKSRPWRSSAF
jgi:5-methylthioadenosine/S-adenosylhomocysteine deaminase